MKQYFFSLTFVVILSWPIAEAQAQFARKTVQVSESLKHPVVAAAVIRGLYSANSQRKEIARHVALSNQHLTATMYAATASKLAINTQSCLDRDHLKPVDFNPYSSLKSLKKVRIAKDSLFTIARMKKGAMDAYYKERLTHEAATGDPYCQSALKILKENMIEGHDR